MAIERQVAFQLGDYRKLKSTLAAAVEQEAWRRSSLFGVVDVDRMTVHPSDKWSGLSFDASKERGQQWSYSSVGGNSKGYRNSDFLSSVFAHGLNANAAFDMQDSVSSTESPLPVFQFNRMSRAVNAILWPLKGFHDIGDERFAGSGIVDKLSFGQKEASLFWRGALVGHSLVNGKKKNIQFVVKDYIEGKISRDDMLSHLETLPRFRFVRDNFGKAGFNVGFVFPKRLSYFREIKEIDALTLDFVRREDQLNFRYLMQISGNDWATSFPWHSETNSLVIRESYPWEAFYDCHFHPWYHYLPVAGGFSHLDQILTWAESNADTCEEIVSRAQESSRVIADGELRAEILSRVVDVYNKTYAAEKGGFS
ncbi:glycosyl transferase family 90 [Roseomonas sp. SXEYE001]|nr:glycosyltransferase family 90 protein [Roseomonas sp. SXEYE001]